MSNENKPVLNRTILDVRKVLQDQLERLNATDVNMDQEYARSQAITMVSNQLISSAKIEADLMAKNPKFIGTGFISHSDENTRLLENK